MFSIYRHSRLCLRGNRLCAHFTVVRSFSSLAGEKFMISFVIVYDHRLTMTWLVTSDGQFKCIIKTKQ